MSVSVDVSTVYKVLTELLLTSFLIKRVVKILRIVRLKLNFKRNLSRFIGILLKSVPKLKTALVKV